VEKAGGRIEERRDREKDKKKVVKKEVRGFEFFWQGD
jgi:hypothetical protein